ncbi:IclR family transcriptional regulator [Conexibacter sp. JD483]|uniref:IclR family transcriptional regulator n=1 Tax=unclassified Conexibacter TaxID=2627773 RepID=UPI0027214E88|nr:MULTISPECIES: IclR family transcriptional regulator [unclassified Conexibacter]MDO8187732.1 IclR family transcriptional regulator [Conexibacter sp. CPCC 205706]MDO8200235.1 IclR family transcriptional regulator [Conexibacter sp. CPCC 205762]MDR9369411.1 IclR family transcriptional regulator [Conexibacter sp. JD483]
MLNTVARVGKVLKLFTTERPEWGVTEVATALSLPKSNAHDMLASLAGIGLLERLPAGRYRLGWRLLAMSRNLVETDGFQRQAETVTQLMARRLGHISSVATWDGRRLVCVAANGRLAGVDGPERAPGVRLPGHSTALGKMLLAHRAWEEVEERATVDGLPAFTEATVATVGDLRAQLDGALRDGVAFDYEENQRGVCCVAAPVRDASARVVAALSVSMPPAVLRRAEPQYARAVAVAAHRLSAMLAAPVEADGAQQLAASA